MRWRIAQHRPPTDPSAFFESMLLLPPPPKAHKAAREASSSSSSSSSCPLPLIVVPHGGPHSCTPSSFLAAYAFLAVELGAAVLQVNYRGSTGFGRASIDSLPGCIGANDVQDCVQAVRETLEMQQLPRDVQLDASKLVVVGGSHGGFLTGHLIGQHPGMFRAAAMRNPVTNIPAMFGTTDIPDWTVVECGFKYDFSTHQCVSAEMLAAMLAASPVAHVDKVKTPTLVALGAKDRRVPASQGEDFHHLLRARGVPTSLLRFPEDTHAIDRPASEAEHFIAIARWFARYLQ